MKTMKATNIEVHSSSAKHWVGDGFPVISVFGYNDKGRELSPFLLLDYAAPHRFEPANARRGVGEHPHRGFETVTIAYQGEIEHRDSHGGGGKIGPGDVQWMTAASGLVHEEFHSDEFTRSGGLFEMVQLWVNLPAKDKQAKPGYQTLAASEIPVVPLAGGGHVRVIAGEFDGKKGPARTFTPIDLWDVALAKGGNLEIELPPGHTKAFLVLSGSVVVGDRDVAAGELAVFDRDSRGGAVVANAESKLLVLAGAPIEEPIVGHGPFVMNTQAEIKQAFLDYQSGKFGTLA